MRGVRKSGVRVSPLPVASSDEAAVRPRGRRLRGRGRADGPWGTSLRTRPRAGEAGSGGHRRGRGPRTAALAPRRWPRPREVAMPRGDSSASSAAGDRRPLPAETDGPRTSPTGSRVPGQRRGPRCEGRRRRCGAGAERRYPRRSGRLRIVGAAAAPVFPPRHGERPRRRARVVRFSPDVPPPTTTCLAVSVLIL